MIIATLNNKIAMFFLVVCFTLITSMSSKALANEEVFFAPAHESDPIESVNRVIFKFNDKADEYLVKPAAKVYRYVTPEILDKGITNIFNNLDDVETFVNSLFQLKFHNAIVTLNRIIYNTTFGLAGFFDVATSFGLNNNEEDFGQTLGYWGYEESTYLVLPFLGPSTLRDFSGRLVDASFDPLIYNDDIHRDKRLMAKGLKLLDLRADLLAAENLQLSNDRYAFFRNAYLQNRDYLIKDGEIEDPFSNDDIDYDSF